MRPTVLLALLLLPFSLIAQSSPNAAPGEELSAAETAITKADWTTAESKLAPWVQAHPTDARALFDLGYVADAQNKPALAAELYRRALAIDSDSAEARLSLGLLLARQGKSAEARTELEAATKIDAVRMTPELKGRAWRALAQIDRDIDPKQASSELLKALELTPETTADTLLAASVAERAGELTLAETAYRKLLAADPGSVQANAGLAHVLIVRKQYAEAETLLRKAIEQSPTDPTLTSQLAVTLAAQGKPEAIDLLQNLHQSRPQDRAITLMLADLLADAGDAAASDKIYLELLAAAPEDSALLVAHGQNLVRLQRSAEAVKVFVTATQIDPANADGWSGMAFAAARTNQHPLALQALTQRAKFLPEGPSTYFLWATSYDALHEAKNAVRYYKLFLSEAGGNFPDQANQARLRLAVLEKKN